MMLPMRPALERTVITALVGMSVVGSLWIGAGKSASPSDRVAFIDPSQRLALVDGDGERVRVLTKARDVAAFEWSPDGTKLLFVRRIQVGYDRGDAITRPAIFVVNTDGSGQRRLSPPGTHDLHPTWSPDGRKIAFERAADLVDGLRDDIWVMNADGSGSRRLTHHPVLDREPTWSPDGREIAWVRGWPGALHVMVMNADGSKEHRLLGSRLQTTNPAWSPDGRRLAVTGFDTKALYVVRRDGSGLTRLVKGLEFDTVGRWAPDSRRIGYAHDGSLYVVDTTARPAGPRRLHSGWTLDWSPRGDEIAFDDSAVFVMRDDGSRSRRLARGRDPAWRP